MKTKRFKIIALICAALFTITLAIGIVFACLPEERKVESAVPLADTTTPSIWENGDSFEYTDVIIVGNLGGVTMDERYRATDKGFSFETYGIVFTDTSYQTKTFFQLDSFYIMGFGEMQSEGYDPSSDCPVYVSWRDSAGQVSGQPLFDCVDFVFVFNYDSVPYCIVEFFEYASKNTSGLESVLTSGRTEGYSNGYRAGITAGTNQSYNVGYDDGYSDCEADNRVIWTDEGYDEGYSAGYSYGSSKGYDNGYEEGYDVGYADGENHSISSQFTNPIGYFLQPVHDFMNTKFFGDISYASVFNVILFVSVAIIFIKMFSGG